MATLTFKTVEEALVSLGQVDENYGFEIEGTAEKLDDGTVLLVEKPLTALVVVKGRAHTTGEWTHPNLQKLWDIKTDIHSSLKINEWMAAIQSDDAAAAWAAAEAAARAAAYFKMFEFLLDEIELRLALVK